MIILKGKNTGFCFGVKRAVKEAEKLKGDNNYVLGEIIHNEEVNEKLLSNGVKIIDSLDSVTFNKGDNLLIRTHGEPKTTFDDLENLGVNVIDCTCPFVKEIHNIVEKHHKEGFKIVIIGNKDHPEVKGINGWCENTALITENIEELNLVEENKVCIVVQTTYREEKFDFLIKNFVYDRAKTVVIFKTICYTTIRRQAESEVLSKKCDAVLVIGGAKSNNTQKLFDICSKNCPHVFRLVRPSEFDYEKIKNFNNVGVVLGASTPIEQFWEVVSIMENITEVKTSEINEVAPESVQEVEVKEAPAVKSEFEAAVDQMKTRNFRPGQIITANVSSVNENGITVSLKDVKKDFDISKEDLLLDDINAYVVGSDIRVMVTKKSPLELSEKAMQKVLQEEAEVKEIAEGKIFEAVVEATNKGGLIAKYGSYQVFVPSSQIKLGFVKDLDKYVGKTLRLKAEKVENRGRNRQIVASQKVILLAEKEERDAIKAQKEAEFFDSIQEGDVVLGTPVRFAPFGAFINVNGFDCLAHISDLAWSGCKECSDVLELNKQYEFIILKIDLENKKVSVGYKQLQPKPWDLVSEKYAVGDVVNGKVVRIVKFGAFVEIEKGVDALVHISQIANTRIENAESVLEVGQEIQAKILAIDVEKEKMNLSIKALLPVEEVPEEETEKKAKGKRAKKEEEVDPDELREWKDETVSGASIAEMLNIEK